MKCALAIMLKAPRPGRVKTRLASRYGARGATRIYRQLVEDTYARMRAVNGLDVFLSVSPGRWDPLFARAPVDHMERILVQGPGDLGARMQSLCRRLLGRYQGVILIGGDCPDLGADLVDETVSRLRRHDVVIGPAVDGGYYLIGLRRDLPGLFAGIDWGSARVLRQTLRWLDRYHVQAFLLPLLTDIDEPQDVRAWKRLRADALASAGPDG